MTNKDIKKTPKWYLVSSIIVAVILTLIDLSLNSALFNLGFFVYMPIIGNLLIFTWFLISFVFGIYLLAKKYPKISLFLPLLFILESLIVLFLPRQTIYYYVILFGIVVIFALVTVGTSLYLLWKE